MKKLISLLTLFSLLFLPMNSILASSDSPTFFEALTNLAQIEDYKALQSIYGKAEIDEFGDHVSIKYRLNINSAADNETFSSSNRVNAYLKLFNHNEVSDSTPFKEMTVQINGELITLNQTDIYFKLSNFNVNLTEALPQAIVDIEGVKIMAGLYTGTWFHVPLDDLASLGIDSEAEEDFDVEQYLEFQEQFQTDPKEAILGAAELSLLDSGEEFSEEEASEILEGLELALKTKLFREREVVAGRNTGFKFFSLDKSAIIKFLQNLADLIEEELSENDINEIRSALSKVSLSGVYGIDDIYGIVDNLLIRFRLKEVDALKNLEVNYRYKLSGLNKKNTINAPSDSEELSLTNF